MKFNKIIRNIAEKIEKQNKSCRSCLKYVGDYASWKEAEKLCEGYGSKTIFQKVKRVALAVKRGRGSYERDGCLFYEKNYNYPLLTYLYQAMLENQRVLKIVDFGGSLGSTYYQNKDLLLGYSVQWTIVEQEHFVEFGVKKFEDNILHFRKNYEEIEDFEEYNCILFSGVLQYIENYEEIIKEILQYSLQYIILERTPVGNRRRIWIQKIKEPIYDASIPCGMFEEKTFVELFTVGGYQLIDSWKSLIDEDTLLGNDKVEYKSFVFKKLK